MRLMEHVTYSHKLKNALNDVVKKSDGKGILRNVGMRGKIYQTRYYINKIRKRYMH